MLRPPLDSSTLVPAWRRVHKVPAVGPPRRAVPGRGRQRAVEVEEDHRHAGGREHAEVVAGRGSEIRVLGASGQRIRAPNIFYGEYSG